MIGATRGERTDAQIMQTPNVRSHGCFCASYAAAINADNISPCMSDLEARSTNASAIMQYACLLILSALEAAHLHSLQGDYPATRTGPSLSLRLDHPQELMRNARSWCGLCKKREVWWRGKCIGQSSEGIRPENFGPHSSADAPSRIAPVGTNCEQRIRPRES